jgi:paraquat-inducible protein B
MARLVRDYASIAGVSGIEALVSDAAIRIPIDITRRLCY